MRGFKGCEFFLFSISFVASTCLAASDEVAKYGCSLGSVEPLAALAKDARVLDLKSRDMSDSVANARGAVVSSIAAKKVIPVRIDATRTDSGTTNHLEGATLHTTADTVEMSADLSLWSIYAKNNRLDADERIKMAELENEKAVHLKIVLTEIIEIIKSISFEKIFNERKDIYEKQLDYYKIQKESGQKVSRETLDISQKSLDNIDKISALKVKKISSALKINLPIEKIEYFNGRNALFNAGKSEFVCSPEDSIRYKIALTEKNFLDTILKEEKYGQYPKLNVFNNYKTTKNAGDESLVNSSTYGVRLSFNLYNGGADAFAIAERVRKIDEVSRKVESEFAKAQLNLMQWQSTKKIYEDSIKTLNIKQSSIYEKIGELSERFKLGDSVFLELSDATLELISVRENIIATEAELLLNSLDVLSAFLKPDDLIYVN
jgi:hypothetical protein